MGNKLTGVYYRGYEVIGVHYISMVIGFCVFGPVKDGNIILLLSLSKSNNEQNFKRLHTALPDYHGFNFWTFNYP